MGLLITELILFLLAATVLGGLVTWGFGSRGGSTTPEDLAALRLSMGRVAALESERDGLASSLSERNEQVAELKAREAEATRFQGEIVEKMKRSEARVSELEQVRPAPAVAPMSMSMHQVAELETLRRERHDLITTYDAAKHAMSEQEKTLEHLTRQLGAAHTRIGQLETTSAVAASSGASGSAELSRIKGAMTKLEAAYQDAEHSLDEQDGAIDQLTRELVQAQRRVAELEQHGPLKDLNLPPSATEVSAEFEALAADVASAVASGQGPSRGLAVHNARLPVTDDGSGDPAALGATLAFALARLDAVHRDHVSTMERLADARASAERTRGEMKEVEALARVTDRERTELERELENARRELEAERLERLAAQRAASLPWYQFRQRRQLLTRLNGRG